MREGDEMSSQLPLTSELDADKFYCHAPTILHPKPGPSIPPGQMYVLASLPLWTLCKYQFSHYIYPGKESMLMGFEDFGMAQSILWLYMPENMKIWSSVKAGPPDSSLLQNAQTCPGDHTASTQLDPEAFSTELKRPGREVYNIYNSSRSPE